MLLRLFKVFAMMRTIAQARNTSTMRGRTAVIFSLTGNNKMNNETVYRDTPILTIFSWDEKYSIKK